MISEEVLKNVGGVDRKAEGVVHGIGCSEGLQRGEGLALPS